MSDFQVANRVMTNWVAAAEKRCLIWLARRTPSRINSDHLTALGFVGMAGVGVSYALSRWDPGWLLAVVVCLAVNWLGDSLDGTLARVRGCQRPRYGFYVDHALDALGSLLLFGGLALSGYMTPLMALGVLVAYFLLSIEVYLATYCLASFRLSFWKLGPTELRVLLAVGSVTALFHPVITILGRRLLLFDVGGAVAIACLLVTALLAIARNTARLFRAEPLPGGQRGDDRAGTVGRLTMLAPDRTAS
jgi:archaetidylinositol phosphate synthase